MESTTMVKAKRQRSKVIDRKVLIIIIIVFLVVGGAVAAVFVVDYNRHEYYNEQISYAQKYLIEKKYDKAIGACDKAIDTFPEISAAYLTYADIYLAQGDKQKAKEILEKGYNETKAGYINKKLEGIKKDIQYDEYVESGKNALSKNNYNDAIRYFKAAIDLKPGIDEPYLLAAEAYIANGEKSYARDVLKDGYSKTNSDKIRGKLILVENELQNVQHQQNTKFEAEKDAQAAKRLAEEEKRQKAEEEARLRAEQEARKKAQKNAKKAEWKEAYTEVLKETIKRVNNPHYEAPYIREFNEEKRKPGENSKREESEEEETSAEESSEEESTDEDDDDDDNESSSEKSDGSSGSSKKKKIDSYAFELYDIDGDGIPELFVSSDETDNATVECYTYANDTAIPFDANGFRGKAASCSSEKLIRFTAIEDGIRHVDIYKKHGINLDTYITFFDNFAAEITEDNPKSATIDGVAAEEGQYNVEMRKFNSYKWQEVGRKYKLSDDTIEKGINAWHL